MASLSFFQAKNSLGSKMKRSIISFCNGDNSTSTLNQQHFNTDHSLSSHDRSNSVVVDDIPAPRRKVTLEEMIMKMELEEAEIARKEKLKEIIMQQQPGRRSCVNNSDILRSARNALNQYPRFSLDGRDAMYRNFSHVRGRNSFESGKRLPSSFGGEMVVWCKPGVIARLMGLDAMPMPVVATRLCSKEKLKSMMKRQSLRQMAKRHENEIKKKIAMELIVGCRPRRSSRLSNASCSKNSDYCLMNPHPDADFEGIMQRKRYQ